MVNAEGTDREVVGSTPAEEAFLCKLIWIKACCMGCNSVNGRVDIEEPLDYKIQLHGLECCLCPAKNNITKVDFFWKLSIELLT